MRYFIIILGLFFVFACSEDRSEVALRKSVEKYIDALEHNDQEEIAKYEFWDGESKKYVQKTTYSNYKLLSINYTPEKADVMIQADAKGFGFTFEGVRFSQKWIYKDGWKIIKKPSHFGFSSDGGQDAK